jgi:putative restriction endonuclease
VVSDKVKDIFNNGEEYRRLHGKRMWLPDNDAHKPDKAALRWHSENRFLG